MGGAEGFCLFETPVGDCALAWSGDVLQAVQLPSPTSGALRARMQRHFPATPESTAPPWVASIIDRIRAVMAGAPDDLRDVPLALQRVPDFHRRVYELARAIPPGQTRTYGELARELGDPAAARAVGQALGQNPFAPVVPCHRILAAGGASGGFSAPGGTRTKLRLLELERARFGSQPGLFDEG